MRQLGKGRMRPGESKRGCGVRSAWLCGEMFVTPTTNQGVHGMLLLAQARARQPGFNGFGL